MFILTDKGKIPTKNGRPSKAYPQITYTLPLWFDESESNYYYYAQSGIEGVKPLMSVKKNTGNFEEDVLSKYENYPFNEEEMAYIMQLKTLT